MTRHRVEAVLALPATVILAGVWHFLAVWASFPLGGSEFHWVFHRPGGGDRAAAYVVGAVYGLVALALVLFLCARTRRVGIWTVGGLIAVTALVSWFAVGWDSAVESLLAVVVTAAPLVVVALLLWRLRTSLPRPATTLLAGAPGAWSLWEMYSFPYASSLAFRRGVLPLVILYPVAFLIVSIALRGRTLAKPHQATADSGQ